MKMGITGNKNSAVEFFSHKMDLTLTGSKAIITFYTIRGQIALYITLRRADKTEFVTKVSWIWWWRFVLVIAGTDHWDKISVQIRSVCFK